MRRKTARLGALIITVGLALIAVACGESARDAIAPTTSSHEGMIEGSVWVADEEGNSLTVIDADTNTAIARVTGVEGPHNIQAAPDGRSVWAVSGHEALALKFDPSAYSLMGAAPTGSEPAHIIVTPDGTTVYVTNGGDDSVTVIDPQTIDVIATIPVGDYPHGLRPSPDGRWVYVANAGGTTLSVIDTSTNQVVDEIEVGQKPVQVGFSSDGRFVYASVNGENAVAKVDVASRTLVDKLEVGAGPIQVFVTPDSATLLVANQGTETNPSRTVSIIDTASFSVVDTVETGAGAHGVVIEPSGRHAYITNIYENSVTVLDVEERRVVANVGTAARPNGISFLAAAPIRPPAFEIEIDMPEHEEEMPGMENME